VTKNIKDPNDPIDLAIKSNFQFEKPYSTQRSHKEKSCYSSSVKDRSDRNSTSPPTTCIGTDHSGNDSDNISYQKSLTRSESMSITSLNNNLKDISLQKNNFDKFGDTIVNKQIINKPEKTFASIINPTALTIIPPEKQKMFQNLIKDVFDKQSNSQSHKLIYSRNKIVYDNSKKLIDPNEVMIQKKRGRPCKVVDLTKDNKATFPSSKKTSKDLTSKDLAKGQKSNISKYSELEVVKIPDFVSSPNKNNNCSLTTTNIDMFSNKKSDYSLDDNNNNNNDVVNDLYPNNTYQESKDVSIFQNLNNNNEHYLCFLQSPSPLSSKVKSFDFSKKEYHSTNQVMQKDEHFVNNSILNVNTNLCKEKEIANTTTSTEGR
jgi:hypothetical protein